VELGARGPTAHLACWERIANFPPTIATDWMT
jgi:hypothetical protein